jgi:hypothetical protein
LLPIGGWRRIVWPAEGETRDEQLARGGLDPEETLAVARRLAKAGGPV